MPRANNHTRYRQHSLASTVKALQKISAERSGRRLDELLSYKDSIESRSSVEPPETVEGAFTKRFSASLPSRLSEAAEKHLRALKANGQIRGLFFPDGLIDGGRITGTPSRQSRINLGSIRIEKPEGGTFDELGLFFDVADGALNLVARVPTTPFSLRSESDSQPGDLNYALHDRNRGGKSE